MQFDDGEHKRAEMLALIAKMTQDKFNGICSQCGSRIKLQVTSSAANDPSYPQPVKNTAIPDHSSANKSAKSEHFSLFMRILCKRYFWHAIALITALALGFVASWLLFLPVTKQAPPHINR